MLQLPPTEKDDRLNLNVRTGSASVLYNSFVFTYGGLTIGLDLDDHVTIEGVTQTFLLRIGTNKSKRVKKYLSGELFYLDLILKTWKRVEVPPGAPKPKPRLFHELAKGDGKIYVFGGLMIPDDVDEQLEPCKLVPCNDLWEFNLTTSSWRQLHDGTGYDSVMAAPLPRFCHKMTLVGSLPFCRKKDHYGLLLAGGLGENSQPLYDNVVFDLVDEEYITAANPLVFLAAASDKTKESQKGLLNFLAINQEKQINVNYLNSIIVNFKEEVEYHHGLGLTGGLHGLLSQGKSIVEEESIIIYSPTKPTDEDVTVNPLLSFRMGKKLGKAKVLSLHKKRNASTGKADASVLRHTIPLNLRYPTGGLFGQNLVITGFLPDDFDISIFIYNKPTGKWSRLNIFCNHDYGSHRFWGGFAWTSHHRVILLGNYVTSKTTSSVRYFSSMITVSLPVTNILASSELAGSHYHGADGKRYNVAELSSVEELMSTSSSFTEDDTSSSHLMSDTNEVPEIPHPARKFSGFSAQSDGKGTLHAITFSDYVHYAAPKVNFTKVRSVFPPAAITLGRNAFDRYGDLISDFELISCNGDRLPVSMTILMERWGLFFIGILSRSYVKAIDKFESDQSTNLSNNKLRSSKSSGGSVGLRMARLQYSGSDTSNSDSKFDNPDAKMSFLLAIPKLTHKEAPQFRLPFQDGGSSHSVNEVSQQSVSVDPHKQELDKTNSTSSFSSAGSLLTSHLQEIPPQLPLPSEPIPAVPTTPTSYRSSSRKNSTDAMSPRASILHTLTALRNIPTGVSPFASPRGSISASNEPMIILTSGSKEGPKSIDEHSDSSETPSRSSTEPERKPKSDSPGCETPRSQKATETLSNLSLSSAVKAGESGEGHTLLDFTTIDPETFKMEPSLIPRKLYIPFGTTALKAFCEYLYTGQVGNKWTLKPALDCMLIARYYKVPLLYDLLCEVLYGIIGRKEHLVVKQGNKLKKRISDILEKTHGPMKSKFKSPLDEYEGFMDTVDDGYLDIALLRKSSSLHKNSVSTIGSGKKKLSSTLSMSSSADGHNVEGEDYFQHKPSEPKSPKSGNIEDKISSEEEISTDNSGEEDAKFELSLHYLDYQDRKVSLGPRSRSVFDRSLYDSIAQSNFDSEDYDEEQERLFEMTLEQLVAPDSHEPSSYVIDLIYETVAMCTDVKLMLRSMNVRHMVRALKETKDEYEKLQEHLEKSLENERAEQERMEQRNSAQRESVSTITSGAHSRHGPIELRSHGNAPTTSASRLEPSRSQSSLTASTSMKSENMSRAASSLKFSSFKNPKIESVDTNRELDRKIAQLIKRDEKLKQKQAKQEKSKKSQLEKEKRKQSATLTDDRSDTTSLNSRTTVNDGSLISHHKSRMLKRLGTKLSGKDDSDGQSLSRTKLSSSLTSGSSNKKSARKGLFGLRKK